VFWGLALATGVAAGLAAAVLTALLRLAQHLAWAYRSGDFPTAVEHVRVPHRLPVVVFAGLALLSVPYPELRGHGLGVVQRALLGELGFGLVVAVLVLKPLAVAGCLGSGAPGGLFTPTLTFGALVGLALVAG